MANDMVSFEQLNSKWERSSLSSQDKRLNFQSTLEDDTLTIQCLTWNVEGFSPTSSEHVKGLFGPVVEYRPPIIVMALQEIFEMKTYNISKILSNSSKPDEAKQWEKMLVSTLRTIDPSYRLLTAEANGGVMMILFTNLPETEIKLKKAIRTNLGSMGGMMANKSAVTINLIAGRTKLQFTGCHLASGEGKKDNAERESQLISIIPAAVENKLQESPKKKVDLD